MLRWAQKAHTEWQGKKRGGTVAGTWAQERNCSDSNNTLPLISLISSFLWLKVYYSEKSAAVVFAWNETLPTWVAIERRSRSTGLHTWRALQLTLIFVPSSSGSGSGIISIWEHRKQQKERGSISRSDSSMLSTVWLSKSHWGHIQRCFFFFFFLCKSSLKLPKTGYEITKKKKKKKASSICWWS